MLSWALLSGPRPSPKQGSVLESDLRWPTQDRRCQANQTAGGRTRQTQEARSRDGHSPNEFAEVRWILQKFWTDPEGTLSVIPL